MMTKRRSIGVCTRSASTFGIAEWDPVSNPNTLGSAFAFENKEGIWLDGLPDYVRFEVADKVCNKKPSEDALHLAETSANLTEAVAHSPSYSLLGWKFVYMQPRVENNVVLVDEEYEQRLIDAEENVRQRWIQVMKPLVVQTDGDFVELFDAPRVRKLIFDPLTTQVAEKTKRYASRFQSIRYRLEIHLRLDYTIDYLEPSLPLQFLQVLSPRKLRLKGHLDNHILLRKGGRVSLANCCPLLESFHLGSSKMSLETISRVVGSFPILKEFRMGRVWSSSGCFPDGSSDETETAVLDVRISWMRNLEALELECMPTHPVDFARKVGPSLQAFSVKAVTPQDICWLKDNNFKKLVISCKGPAEEALRDNVQSFASIRVLSLEWPEGGEYGYRSCQFYEAKLYASTEGAIFYIVKHLRELKLLRMRITHHELCNILRHLASRLRDQALLCRYENGITRRHNGLRDFLCYRVLKPLGMLVLREHPMPRLFLGPNDLDSPLRMDLYVPAATNFLDNDQAIDITVAFPKAASHLLAAARTAGSATTSLEGKKHRTYGAICRAHSIDLRPVGVDVYGAMGKDGTDFFRSLATHISTRNGNLPPDEERSLYERFTIALHTLQARMLLTRLAS